MREGKTHLGLQSKKQCGRGERIENIIKKWVAIITKILILEWQLKHLKNQLKQHRINV
jgi:hypothetical protein